MKTYGGVVSFTPRSQSGQREEKIIAYWDSNSEPSDIQPVVSRYTDYATPAPANSPYQYRNRVTEHLVQKSSD
jgi:hypothetical protein